MKLLVVAHKAGQVGVQVGRTKASKLSPKGANDLDFCVSIRPSSPLSPLENGAAGQESNGPFLRTMEDVYHISDELGTSLFGRQSEPFLRSQFCCWVRMYSFAEGILMVFMPLLYSVVSYEQRASLKATFLRFSVSFIMTNCGVERGFKKVLHGGAVFDIVGAVMKRMDFALGLRLSLLPLLGGGSRMAWRMV